MFSCTLHSMDTPSLNNFYSVTNNIVFFRLHKVRRNLILPQQTAAWESINLYLLMDKEVNIKSSVCILYYKGGRDFNQTICIQLKPSLIFLILYVVRNLMCQHPTVLWEIILLENSQSEAFLFLVAHNRFKALFLLWTLRFIDWISLGANAVP